ncbi:uncharacterized protein LOC109712477 [Ananas comosus]|uniref:Uncharacterized protein LOC109712477 n=1 Tax=Ananas comosus TaxID=4615 RepID=A0A199V816_ANACO|nr:uncharacterized protein LOC109712477 [Ananas comosus]OAY73237.1 hypothetical protein ACMD2_02825 [Ananas comosus]
MGSSSCVGLMAVVAVSSSVALVAFQIHRRLTSEFLKKIESELGNGTQRIRPKKKVSFAADVIEPSSNNKEYRRRRSSASAQPIESS